MYLFGSRAAGTHTDKSDWDVFISLEEAIELNAIDEFIWTLAGSNLDAYYLDSITQGYPWARSVSDPMRDNPLEQGEHWMWWDGDITDCIELTIEELLEARSNEELFERLSEDNENDATNDVDRTTT